MISNATKRAILRWTHLSFAIPIIGYVYSPFAELPNYAPIVRYVAFPVILLSGLWMYAGMIFAFIGVAVWLGAYQLFGMGPAILSLIVLLIARKVWLVVRARRSKRSAEQNPAVSTTS
jgi:predicted tellurium resistance membrane protein TerC